MQRLSIGSPSRVHVISREVAPTAPEEEKEEKEEKEEIRPEKPIRQSYTTKERLVHVIPVLTLLCVLVLYLSSHDLSSNAALLSTTTDTASFGDASRFIHSSSNLPVPVITEMGRYEGEAAGAIVNHRPLKANTKLGIRKLGSVKEQGSACSEECGALQGTSNELDPTPTWGDSAFSYFIYVMPLTAVVVRAITQFITERISNF